MAAVASMTNCELDTTGKGICPCDPTPPEADEGTVLICNVIFRNGQPVFIRGISDSHPSFQDHPLMKAFDLETLLNSALIKELEAITGHAAADNKCCTVHHTIVGRIKELRENHD